MKPHKFPLTPISVLILAYWLIALPFGASGQPPTSGKALLTGIVRAEGNPLSGVRVSDGLQIVTTDDRGCYRMSSDKAEGVVFIIPPSHFIAKSKDGLQPRFWALLTKNPGIDEQCDFELRHEDQKHYTVLFLTDLHLTNSDEKRDIDHFRTQTLPALRGLTETYMPQGPVYSFNLGDLTHELYWELYKFNIASAREFLACERFPTPLYSIPGNHDNDGAITGPDADFKAGWLYRKNFGPTYYSMDIGGEHWIMMDDILYRNTPGTGKKNPGIAGARDYDKGFTPRQMEWLQNDLAFVAETTPIYLCTHCPLLHTNERGLLLSRTSQMDSLDNLFARFGKVTIFSGHLHKMHLVRNDTYPRFEQHSLPATSGNMWVTSNDFQTICPDGTDAGVLVGTFGSDEPQYSYHTSAYGLKVLRCYDMNTVGEYYRTNEGIRLQQTIYPARTDYGSAEFKNHILVNYWCYRPGERVELYEDGRKLSVAQIHSEDPLYNISYYVPLVCASPKYKTSQAEEINQHLFIARAESVTTPVEIRITDASGRLLHHEIITRPKPFNKDTR